MAETWRIVLADGTVREVVVRAGHSFTDGVGYFARLSPTDTMAFGADPRGAVLRLAVARYLDVAEILSPGEPSRAELTAERDEATRFTAQLSTALADRRALALDAVRDALGATEHEGAVDAAKRVIAQRDAARREGAEAMRRDAMRACSAIEDERAAAAQWRRTHGSRATREEDCQRLGGQAIGAAACEDALCALPIPTRPEVSR